MDEIRNEVEYLSRFPRSAAPPTGCSFALQVSLDTRRFEIELYWKRAAYFWTLIAAAFTGYFALSVNGKSPNLVFLITCMGLLLSLGWYLVNRGSKYWQENWERHVDMLASRDRVGPLFSTTVSEDEYPWRKLCSGYRYSVSKINQVVSLFVVLIWIGLAAMAFPDAPYRQVLLEAAPWIAAISTTFFAALLLWCGQSGNQATARRINFRIAALDATKRKCNADKCK